MTVPAPHAGSPCRSHAPPQRRLVAAPWAALALALVGCSTAGPPRAAPGQIPPSVTISETSFQFGFAVGRRTSTVSIPTFGISKTPISVGQYKECVAAGACSVPGLDTPACRSTREPIVEGATYDAGSTVDGLPVTCVSPRQAVDYCTWVGGALPTIEEWVYAARGPNVQEFAWGSSLADCTKNQRALRPHGQSPGCCPKDTCDPKAYYAVAQRPDVVSPAGALDVLLTPSELIRGHQGAPVPACSNDGSVCAVRGVLPGAIDYAAPVSADVDQNPPDLGVVPGFRCAFEVTP